MFRKTISAQSIVENNQFAIKYNTKVINYSEYSHYKRLPCHTRDYSTMDTKSIGCWHSYKPYTMLEMGLSHVHDNLKGIGHHIKDISAPIECIGNASRWNKTTMYCDNEYQIEMHFVLQCIICVSMLACWWRFDANLLMNAIAIHFAI